MKHDFKSYFDKFVLKFMTRSMCSGVVALYHLSVMTYILTGLILGLCPANGTPCYSVTTFLIG